MKVISFIIRAYNERNMSNHKLGKRKIFTIVIQVILNFALNYVRVGLA